MRTNSFVHQLTKALVDIMFYCGVICCVFIWFIVKRAMYFFGYPPAVIMPISIILLTSGVASVYILYQLKNIFKTLTGGNPFVMKNVVALRKMSVSCFIISIIYICKCIFWFTLATSIIVIIFAIAGLFCLTLKDVFKQAIKYKEENDLTV